MIKIYKLPIESKMETKLIDISNNKVLVGGIYSLNEAALYAKVSTKTLKRWYLGDTQTKKVIENDELIENGRFLNFLDFIQALGIRTLRVHYHLPLPKIREAIRRAQDEYDIKYPFAKNHKTYFDRNGIYIQLDQELVQLTSPHANQITMKQIVEYYLTELKFDDEGYACQYRPEEGILLDPSLRFGEPLLEKFGVTAPTIYDAVITEGDLKIVAELYEVDLKQVEIAYKYIDSLKQVA